MSTFRPIQQLSPSLVNRIAAGEVIERPAAVVKELVENAIDAGATRIAVEIEDGGRALIRVIDNGAGIPPEQLPLAFASHATSKLSCDDDLFQIATMGFRGEALASIGAVSQARILSRTADNEAAYEVHNRGGVIGDPQAAAGNLGSTVEVRNLFFNTPARRKFIKGSPAEFGHISEMLLRLALPHPQVTFTLSHNNRPAMDLPMTSAQSRLLEAWPKEYRESALGIDVQDAELRLSGIVGMPELCRPSAKYQFFYLNGRHIRDRFIQHALREAYRGLSEPGRHPAGVLLLRVPPQDVDVNVHPTKIEVRFKDSGRIHGLVHSAVREKLQASDLTPIATPTGAAAGPAPREDLREKLAAFFKEGFSPQEMNPAVAQPRLPMPDGAADNQPSILPTMGSGGTVGPDRNFGDVSSPAGERRLSTFQHTQLGPDDGGTNAGLSSDVSAEFIEPHPPGESAARAPQTPTAPIRARIAPTANPAIQLHNSYLVAQSDDGLVIIDQHALHERIMYEELLARVSRGPLEAQRLLIPEVVDVSTTQLELLEQIQPLLVKIGIEVSAFGPTSVAVHAFPSFLEKLEPGNFVRELLERGEQELLDLHEEEVLHDVLDMMACKAAVKAGDPLTSQEIEALLARRELIDRSSNCPHGRPTTLRLSLRDLEKQFKRTGF
ncbi:MAG TPA: DNA mismatch repair endonuclease MutL [Tepidisphaeraceae bacterium]|nr:DNA mismatch repair endonuclease MutL [Tepidisphaeraceae bacterium]